MPVIEIPGLPSTSTVADTDLFHIRNGDIDKKITTADLVAEIVPGQATTTTQGIIELATQTEVNTGTDNERAVTPLTLQNKLDAAISSSGAPNATETNRGLIEIATSAEGITGTDTERAVTPKVMKDSVTTHVAAATTATAGKAAIASQGEVNAGTDNTKFVTPLTLANAPGVSVPSASTTVEGKIEIATQGETDLGTDDTRAVTPSTLKNSIHVQVPTASTTVSGKVELADLSETQIGTDQTRAVTPYGLKNALPTLIPTASETNSGIAEIATLAEVSAGVDTSRFVTPYTLAQSLSGSSVPNATETVAGKVELATLAEAQAGTDTTNKAIIPSTLKNSVMTHVLAADGAGSGLDADLLDGVQGSGYSLASHTHPWPLTLSFSTTTGVVTMTRQTGGDLTVDLDGKYVEDASAYAAWEYNKFGSGFEGHYYLASTGYPSGSSKVLEIRNLNSNQYSHGVSGYTAAMDGQGVIGYTAYSGTTDISAAIMGNYGAGGIGDGVSTALLGSRNYAVRAYYKPMYSASGYQPFTGSHIGFTKANLGRSVVPGDLVEVEDAILFDVNDSAPIVSKCTAEKSKKVIGVCQVYNRLNTTNALKGFAGVSTYGEGNIQTVTAKGQEIIDTYAKYKTMEINSLGEGGINVCELGGDIEIGDYLCSSSLSGKAMKQDDDLLHNYTVGKAMQNVKWEDEVSGKTCSTKDGVKWKMIGTTYHCG